MEASARRDYIEALCRLNDLDLARLAQELVDHHLRDGPEPDLSPHYGPAVHPALRPRFGGDRDACSCGWEGRSVVLHWAQRRRFGIDRRCG